MLRIVKEQSKGIPRAQEGLKVIAAGLPRCATSSLQSALEDDLGYGPCMHMAQVAPYTERLKLCYAAELELDKVKRQKLLRAMFDGYSSSTDFPGICFIDDLLEMYPDAKVILNKRDNGEQWLKSITSTLKFFSSTTYLLMTYLISTDYWHYHVHQAGKVLWQRRFGFGGGDKGIFVLETYETYNQWVRDLTKMNGKTLLEWQPQDGWVPLCMFLDRPVPDKKFPHMNDEKVMRRVRIFLVVRGLLAWAILMLIPAGVFRIWSWIRL